MKKLTMKQIRKIRLKAVTYILNSWYTHPDLLTPKHASYLSVMVER